MTAYVVGADRLYDRLELGKHSPRDGWTPDWVGDVVSDGSQIVG